MNLVEFVRESNRIEGIKYVRLEEVAAHSEFLDLEVITVGSLCLFVKAVADARLRRLAGMNVRVGRYTPPPGGPDIEERLGVILTAANSGSRDPYKTHCDYETLHPFIDGNGRSGRALWAWQMRRAGRDPFAMPFLQRFYYQALDASRGHGRRW